MKKVVLLLFFVVTAMQAQTVNYAASTVNFCNPERGFYKYTIGRSLGTFSPLVESTLMGYRNADKITLILRMYSLDAFKSTPISADFLDKIENDFAILRTAGVKCVLRFRYTDADGEDATKAQIIAHIDQLMAVTIPNQDVISSVSAGFIGQYGEWYDSDNFGTSNLTAQNLADRKEIGLKIMELAPDRMVAFRTPFIQKSIAGNATVSASNAYNGSISSRVAMHNDAFLSSDSDYGTYTNTATDYPYLEAQSRYTYCGGESNDLDETYSNCSNALYTLNRFHYNYLNAGYFPAVISLWQTEGCYNEIQRRLGYRYELISTAINNNALTINLRNVGFANLFNERTAYLVYRNFNTGVEYSSVLNTDPRLWMAGNSTQIVKNLAEENLPAGHYQLFLNLPDATIASPLHSIQFANSNVWESATGYNNLSQLFTVGTLGVHAFVADSTLIINDLGNYKLQIFDLTGRLVATSNDISHLQSAVYILKIQSDQGSFIQKIFK